VTVRTVSTRIRLKILSPKEIRTRCLRNTVQEFYHYVSLLDDTAADARDNTFSVDYKMTY
jgi:hypothetical protein